MNILVVEDVKEQREAMVKMIERNYIDSRIYSTDSVEKVVRIDSKVWDIYFGNCKESIPLGYRYKDVVMERLK